MVGARAVIAHGLRGPGAKEYRARAHHLLEPAAGLAHLEDQMLRGVLVGNLDGALEIPDDEAAAARERLLQDRPARERARLAGNLGGDRLRERAAWRHQNRLCLRVMLRLCQQV